MREKENKIDAAINKSANKVDQAIGEVVTSNYVRKFTRFLIAAVVGFISWGVILFLIETFGSISDSDLYISALIGLLVFYMIVKPKKRTS